MRKFFYPDSIVVCGVSDSPSNLGRVIVENSDAFGFRGNIYLVGRGASLGGRKIYPAMEDLPAVPDLAILLVRAELVPEMLDACGRKGVRHVVIETGGFSEFKKDRYGLEKKIRAVAERWQIRFIGPNCIGVINFENGLVEPFVPFERDKVRTGDISMISQSGGLIHNVFSRASLENFGLNKMMSIGNKLMLGESDFLEFLITDAGTKIISLYLESILDGRRLMDLIASTDKPVIVLKANRTGAGKAIAQFHTAALSGEDAVSDAALRQCGAHRVDSLEEMIDLYKVFSLPLLKGANLVLITRSGGLAVLLADSAVRHGLQLARLPDDFLSMAKKGGRAGVIRATNPIDLGDIFDYELYLRLVRKALETKGVDGVVFFHEYAPEERDATEHLIKSVFEMVNKYRKPVALGLLPDKDDAVRMKELCELPTFSAIDSAMRALDHSLRHYRRVAEDKKRGRRKRYVGEPRSAGVGRRSARALLLPANDVFPFLASHGLPVIDCAVVQSPKEAVRVARQMGYPVALKTASPLVLHKTEQGGVVLGLQSDAALKDALSAMRAEEYLVQKMAAPGYEVFVGAKKDPEFGPVVLFGSGGVLVELVKDVAIRVAPLDVRTARQMIGETHAGILLNGYRGRQAADKEALIRFLVRFSRLLVEHPEIVDVDINPLIVSEGHGGCVVVDAKVRMQLLGFSTPSTS